MLKGERGRRIGYALLAALEQIATSEHRHLLYPNTRSGEYPVALYERAGFSIAGVIPSFTRDAEGDLHDTVLMYRRLLP